VSNDNHNGTEQGGVSCISLMHVKNSRGFSDVLKVSAVDDEMGH